MFIQFPNTCSAVKSEVLSRILGAQQGFWHDPHNNGTYTLKNTTTTRMYIERVTGDGSEITDKMRLDFSQISDREVTQGCLLVACSESQRVGGGRANDKSTNYCNLRNLYGVDKGGHYINEKLAYTEIYIDCVQNDLEECVVEHD